MAKTLLRSVTRVPRPFLKWAGGKGQLLGALLAQLEKAGEYGRYHEPFVGGGALFFELSRTAKGRRPHAYLSDNNPNLIDAYVGVRDDVDRLIEALSEHKRLHSEDYYYHVREHVPKGLIARAARIIYLNKTGYNGLYRENSKGKFNVPFGRYKNPLICDERNLRAVAESLKGAKIECRHFATVLEKAKPGDLVYFDPPYVPLSKTASFTQYHKEGFDEDDQTRLAEVYARLDEKGVHVILSNSETPLIKKLYPSSRFKHHQVQARRLVNSKADRRGPINEAIITNF